MLKICRCVCERVYGFRSGFEEEMKRPTLGDEGVGVKVKGIGNHRFNDFTVRV